MENSKLADYSGGSPRVPDSDADTKTLQDLLHRISGGDHAAFAEFYRRTIRRVYGLTRRVLVDPELSEDAAQEVYLEVWRLAARYDARSGTPLAWLLTISHHRAVDKVRSAQAAANREARYAAASQSLDYDLVVEAVTQRSESAAMVECVKVLSRIQHESILLAYYGGLTYQEVAERLGVPVPTVKSRIRDGLLRLKTCMDVS